MRHTALITMLLLSAAARIASAAGAGSELETMMKEAWAWEMAEDPVAASLLGETQHNERWRDISAAAERRRQDWRIALLERIDRIDTGELSDEQRLNLELFRLGYLMEIEGYAYRDWLVPFSHMGGIQTADELAEQLRFASAKDYRDWLSRMEALDGQIADTITLLRQGIDEGRTLPRVLGERIPDQIAAQLVEDPEASGFYRPFREMAPTIDAVESEALRDLARQVITEEIVPAYRELLDFMQETYLPASRMEIGASTLPDGEAFYEYRARLYTTTGLSVEEIHEIGLAEVRRIRGEMEAIIERVGFDGDFQQFIDFLRTDSQFYFETPEQLLTAYRATSKQIDPELVKLFGKLPRMPYGVRPIPDAIAPDTTTAYYARPAADGSRAGIYYVNLYRPEVRPKYEIEVLTVHEAMPGHHLQIALAQELGDLPEFRRYRGFTAFVEGWGLYSESLGEELGLYRDPYSKFGQLTYEMWRAVRLVVDTGIHSLGWSRARAIEFFKANAAKTEYDIVNEIDRYIAWPGQALAYKIGEMKIWELRRRAEAALGENFDIRAFHDELLAGGALPLDVLERRMTRWLTAQITGG